VRTLSLVAVIILILGLFGNVETLSLVAVIILILGLFGLIINPKLVSSVALIILILGLVGPESIFLAIFAIFLVIWTPKEAEEEEKQRVEREAQRVEREAQARRYRNEQRKKKEEKNRKLWNVRKMRLLSMAVEMFSDIKSFEMDYLNEELNISIGCEPYTTYIEYPNRPVLGMSFSEQTKTYANLVYSNALTRTDQSLINEMRDDKNRKVWIEDRPSSRIICPNCRKRYSTYLNRPYSKYCIVCDDDADC
jgi:hypothetical protein